MSNIITFLDFGFVRMQRTAKGKGAGLLPAGSLCCPERDCSVVLCHPGQGDVRLHEPNNSHPIKLSVKQELSARRDKKQQHEEYTEHADQGWGKKFDHELANCHMLFLISCLFLCFEVLSPTSQTKSNHSESICASAIAETPGGSSA